MRVKRYAKARSKTKNFSFNYKNVGKQIKYCEIYLALSYICKKYSFYLG